MKKKLIILFMMILLTLSLGVRNAAAEDTDETRAISQVELTYVIFGYEEGQEEWIPGLTECPVPEPYDQYGDGYWAGKKTYEVSNGEELMVQFTMDPAYGVTYPGSSYDYYYFSRMQGILFYNPQSAEKTIYLRFFKFPLLDFGEDHKDLLKQYVQSSDFRIYEDRYLKLDAVGSLTAPTMYDYFFKEIVSMCGGTDTEGNKFLADNNEYLMSLSRNSADADLDAIAEEICRYTDTDNDYTRMQQNDRFYLVWYSYDQADGDETWQQESKEGPSFTIKRNRDDGGIDYSRLADAYYDPNSDIFKMDGYKKPGSTYSEFDHAEVEGTAVNAATTSGSVVITLDPADLNALEPGKHELTVYFKDGLKVSTSFTILEAKPEPEPQPQPQPEPQTKTETSYNIPITGID